MSATITNTHNSNGSNVINFKTYHQYIKTAIILSVWKFKLMIKLSIMSE